MASSVTESVSESPAAIATDSSESRVADDFRSIESSSELARDRADEVDPCERVVEADGSDAVVTEERGSGSDSSVPRASREIWQEESSIGISASKEAEFVVVSVMVAWDDSEREVE